MRIIGGSHKGRRLDAPDGRTVRPTADRAREALFNILSHSDALDLDGARVVDCFAGSGALGLEALSRGADQVFLVDKHPATLAILHSNVAMLKETARAHVIRADATHLPLATIPCHLGLLDPPYHSDLAGPCLDSLDRGGWLCPQALVVAEVAAAENLAPPAAFTITDERIYGAARFVFMIYRPQPPTQA